MLAACLFLIILTACVRTAPPAVAPTADASPVRERTVTLFLWHAWPSPEQHTLATLVDRYNQSHPLIQVIPQAMPLSTLTSELRSAALAGSGPHLVLLQSHTIGVLAQEGLLLPLDSLVSPAERDRLLPAAVGSAQVLDAEGNVVLYGLPVAFDTLALYYNKANLSVPPADTEVLLNTARGLTDATTEPPVWGLAYTLSLDKTIGYLYAFGGRIFDDEGNLVLGSDGREGTERWLQWLVELRQDQQILAVNDSIVVDSALKSQEALMTIDWAHALPSYRELWGDNLGVAVLPRLSATNRPPLPYVQSDVISVNARVVDSAEQQAILDFIRYLLDEDAQRALLEAGKQPTLKNLSLDRTSPAGEIARVFREQARQAQAMPNSRLANIMHDELERMQLKVLRGLAAPADAVTDADAALQERLDVQAVPLE